jgi:peptide/nickel transport system permease protein
MDPRSRAIASLKQNPRTWIGATILLLAAFAAVGAGVLAPFPADDLDITRRLLPPGPEHWLGCDQNGGDVLTAMLLGARTSLTIGFTTVLISVSIGLIIGLVSGFYGGAIDYAIMRLVDMLMAFPGLLVALVLASTLGAGYWNIVIAITATGWISTTRIVRGQVLQVRELPFVQASIALGAKDFRIITQHVFPSVIPVLLVHATFSMSGVIVVESGLSFLGLGSQEGAPSWGALLAQGRSAITEAPHLSIFPGIAVMLLVISLNFLGDALRDALDPKQQGAR